MNIIHNIENSIYTGRGSGTGFYCLQEDVIVTNYYVVSGNLKVRTLLFKS